MRIFYFCVCVCLLVSGKIINSKIANGESDGQIYVCFILFIFWAFALLEFHFFHWEINLLINLD